MQWKTSTSKDVLLHRRASFVAKESSWLTRLGACGLNQLTSLLVSSRKNSPNNSSNSPLKNLECKPAESLRLERKIRYKYDEVRIHSLNDINILLSTS